MKKEPGEGLEGNARYEGYIVDLLERLSTKARFTYIINLVGDGLYGRRDENGRWNGMIREVMESVSNTVQSSLFKIALR